MPHKKLFQPLRHANILGYFFYKMHHCKNCRTLKARQTKSIYAGTMKLGQNLCQTNTKTQEKLQVTTSFRDIAIRILVMDISVKANCTAAVQSK
jgi:hypothetical protein